MKESQRIEWKESWRDESLKAICAFANAEGGVLAIGRNDKGVAVGVRDARKLLQDIPNKVRDILGIIVDVDLRVDAGKDIVEIAVAAYDNPINYKGEYYYRSGSTNQALKGAALDRFLMRKVGRHWDGGPVPHVAIKDLSKVAIGTFRKQARESRRMDAAILRESTPGLLDKVGATGRSPLRIPGELPHNWTLAKLKGKHPSERHEHGGLWVEFRFPEGAAGGTTQETLVKTPVEMSAETPVEMSVIALAKTPARILEFLRVNPQASLADVASAIGKTLRTAERASSKLVKDGKLRFVGPRKAGRWEVLK